MEHLFPSAVGVARWIERSARAARFRDKMGKGKTSTEAFALILAHPGEPILRNTSRAGARCRNCAISPQMNLCTLKNQESTSTRVESSTAVQHLTKTLFLSKPVEPPLMPFALPKDWDLMKTWTIATIDNQPSNSQRNAPIGPAFRFANRIVQA